MNKPTPSDITAIKRAISKENKLLADQIEAAELGVKQTLDDLSRENSMGFAEVHGKIDYLRSEINEVKQLVSLSSHGKLIA